MFVSNLLWPVDAPLCLGPPYSPPNPSRPLPQVAAAKKTGKDVDVAVVPPYPFIAPVAQALSGSGVWVGAQDFYMEDKGAFTGAVAVNMVKSVGAQWVLVGHSERRRCVALCSVLPSDLGGVRSFHSGGLSDRLGWQFYLVCR